MEDISREKEYVIQIPCMGHKRSKTRDKEKVCPSLATVLTFLCIECKCQRLLPVLGVNCESIQMRKLRCRVFFLIKKN